MNKIIVSVAIVMGLLVSVGFCQTKSGFDSRLSGGWVSNDTACYDDLSFFPSSGIYYLYRNVCPNDQYLPSTYEKGTWCTRNDTLFLYTPDLISITGKYSVNKTHFKFGEKTFLRPAKK
jgi:hypothetical protein